MGTAVENLGSRSRRRLNTPWYYLLGLYGLFVAGLFGINQLPFAWWRMILTSIPLVLLTLLLIPLISYLHKRPVQKAREAIATEIFHDVLAGRPVGNFLSTCDPS